MKKIKSPEELEQFRSKIQAGRDPKTTCIAICAGTGCLALGSDKIIAAFKEEISKQGLDADVATIRETGCPGFCEQGPIVVIYPEEICYLRVAEKDVPEIISKTVINKEVIERLTYKDPTSNERIIKDFDIPFYKKQKRYIIGNNINIDPRSIEDYIATNGYSALSKVLFNMSQENVIEEVTKANLRGRGGAGFPAGLKWKATRQAKGEPKYLICNADEGDPGAFMDRAVLEGTPHSVLEGMVIGSYAIGCHEGYIYVRNEYPLAVENITIAIEKARKLGLLGKDIMGSGFDFDVLIVRGGGAFVCGEETALIGSIEGRSGEPRAKYVFPAERGLYNKPTNINNVETLANVPLIINKGSEWYRSIGTENSKGTKIFALVGKINNTGLVEVPMGITLREIVYDIGGGIPKGRIFKAVQVGGPSGGCIPESHLDLPVDFDALSEVGSMMGSGGMIVMDDRTCMVDVALYFLKFLEEESCGKCTPCREGVYQMRLILERITEGNGKEEDLNTIEWMGKAIIDGSLCGLGGTAPNPVLTTLRYFRDEYEAHIKEKRCPAGVCKALITYTIDPELCNGCMVCAKICPTEAATGEKKELHTIDQEKCIKCGACFESCKFDAVKVS
ncbi:MAG: NADH-quinone oxidoreductase subunit NuoF [Thermodesulfobacteriota bacterium]|nr:NADH-quinone oxidoreductase subunit NuoF [Thermodesulfobacteriota bacterium]